MGKTGKANLSKHKVPDNGVVRFPEKQKKKF